MNADIKQLWIEALESGRYQQGKGVLHTKDAAGEKFCCLGVLCDLAVKAGVEVTPVFAPHGRIAVYTGPKDHSGWPDQSDLKLPYVVAKWAGLADTSPMVPPEKGRCPTHLSNLNDEGMSFAEIAALIRAEL